MGLEFALASPGIGLNDGGRVDGEGGERVHGDKDDTGVGVDLTERVAVENRVENCKGWFQYIVSRGEKGCRD